MPAATVTRMPVTPEIPVATVTPKPSWGPAMTRAERKRRNAKLHATFGGSYSREEWQLAQALVLAGTSGYRKAVRKARA